jgi:uncharacterized protein with PIN domain
MLGSLAKWLRLLGYDTVYPGPLEDREMAAKAYDEERKLLTRDKGLAARVKGAVFVASDNLDEQLKSVVKALHLELSNTLSRCSICNVPIVDVDRAEVEHDIPPKVLEIQEEFWKCPSCSRVYWRGSHWKDMLERIEKLESELGKSPGQIPRKD